MKYNLKRSYKLPLEQMLRDGEIQKKFQGIPLLRVDEERGFAYYSNDKHYWGPPMYSPFSRSKAFWMCRKVRAMAKVK